MKNHKKYVASASAITAGSIAVAGGSAPFVAGLAIMPTFPLMAPVLVAATAGYAAAKIIDWLFN